MSVSFPTNNPGFRGANQVSRVECDLFELEYEGQLPGGLSGRLYRCGPDPQFPPLLGDDVLINGDGMVGMFRIGDGHVDFTQRWVRTDKFKAERAARRALFGAYRNRYTDDPSVAGMDRTTANTSMLWHGERLFAIKEDGLPHELDPDSLATLGKFDFNGRLRSPHFTAHPKVDPATDQLLFYGFEAAGDATPTIAFATADDRLQLLHEEWFDAPYASMIHDFAVTEHHVVFPVMPTTSNLDRMKAGGFHFAWDDTLPTWIGVLPRAGTAKDIRWFEAPGRWSFHVLNAFEEGSKLHIDLTVSEINGFAYVPSTDAKPWDPARAASYLTRWTIDLAANTDCFSERRLWDIPADFFKTDPRFQTRSYRHGWMAARDGSRPAVTRAPMPKATFNTLAHIDQKSGQIQTWWAGDESTVQEPAFALKSPDAAEGEGWILAVVNRLAENRADLAVFDALALSSGPIAVVKVPIHLRMAFHTEWVPESEISRRSGQP